MSRVPIFLFATAVASCKTASPPSGFGVDLVIDGSTLPRRAEVTQLRVTTSGAETFDETQTTSQIAKTGVVRVRYQPGVDSGVLMFTIEALDSSSQTIGTATPPGVTLVPDQAVMLAVTLAAVLQMGDMSTPMDLYPATCSNGTLDPGEVDVDCGGACPLCEPGKKCTADKDCATDSCPTATAHCELASSPPVWVELASLPIPRDGTAIAALDDGLYVTGGSVSSMISTTTVRYDPVADAWCSTPATTATCGTLAAPNVLPQPMEIFGMTTAHSVIYAMGGLTAVGPPLGFTDAIAVYSDSSSSWSNALRKLSLARGGVAAAAGGDGQVYVAGGQVATPMAAVVATFESFDPAHDDVGTATVLTALPVARTKAAVSADALGRIVVAGGNLQPDPIMSVTTEVDIWDITNGKWLVGAPLSVGRGALGAVLGPDNRVYAVGGLLTATTESAVAEALTSNSDHWAPVAPLPKPLLNVSLARGWDGRIYSAGGDDGTGPIATVLAYGPQIIVFPTSAAPGTLVTVNGNNFAAGANASLTFSGDPTGTTPTPGKTDATGQMSPSIAWKVPATAVSGTYTLTVVDDRSRFPVRASFVVP